MRSALATAGTALGAFTDGLQVQTVSCSLGPC